MDEFYDLILLGIDTEIQDRQATINSLAELLGINEEKIGHIVDNNLKAIVKHGILLDDARNYQQQILRRGGFSNYRPSPKSSAKFELAPIEDEDDNLTFICPACKFREKFPTVAELPLSCPLCGIIPKKYNKVTAEKYERELIKSRLLNKQKLLEKQALNAAQLKEQDARRRKLEDEIRKELGLPRLINSRLRLFGTVAMLWILGLGLGALATGLYFDVFSPFEDWSFPSVTGRNRSNLKASPQQETLIQVSNLSPTSANESEPSYRLEAIPQIGLAGVNPLQVIQRSPTQKAGNAPLMTSMKQKPDPFIGSELLHEMLMDKEWGLFLADASERLARSKQPALALQTAQAIQFTQLKIGTFGLLAEYYLATKNQLEAEKLFAEARAYINGQSDNVERAESLSWWSTLLYRMDEKAKAKLTVENLMKLVSSLPDGYEKAKGLASLATHQAQAGQRKEAGAKFQLANQIILNIENSNQKLLAYAYLASHYAQSGDKVLGTAILLKCLDNVKLIKDPSIQQNLVGEIAFALVSMGEADYAMAALNKLNPWPKESMLFNVTRELAYTNQPYDALKGLDKLSNPGFQARASALLSLTTLNRPYLQPISAKLQEQAIVAQDRIDNPYDQAVVRAEMARYLAHSGNATDANEWARKAMSSVLGVRSNQERDAAYAELANNFAIAKLNALSNECAAKIPDPLFASATAKQISAINKLLAGQ